jgi:hypothetical protein
MTAPARSCLARTPAGAKENAVVILDLKSDTDQPATAEPTLYEKVIGDRGHRRAPQCWDLATARYTRGGYRFVQRWTARAALTGLVRVGGRSRRPERPRTARRRAQRAGRKATASATSDGSSSDPPGSAPLAGERVLHADFGDEVVSYHLIDSSPSRADAVEGWLRSAVQAAGGSMLRAVRS